MKTRSILPSICVVALILMSNGPSVTTAQSNGNLLGHPTMVNANLEQMAIVVGASQRLKFPYKIPELLVSNQEILKADPIRTFRNPGHWLEARLDHDHCQ